MPWKVTNKQNAYCFFLFSSLKSNYIDSILKTETWKILGFLQGRKMINIGICDDENGFVLELRKNLLEYSMEKNVEIMIYPYNNSKDMLSDIEKGVNLDLIFLDIQLKEISGVEVGKKIRSNLENETIQIVFVSSIKNYAMQLFDLRPMNFLIKPINYDKTKFILDEYERLFCLNNSYFEYHIGKSVCKVNEQVILYFQSQAKKVHMYMCNDQVEFYDKLSEIMRRLKDKNFCMVHKSFIINMRYATEYKRDCVVMANGEVIPVSRAMKDNLNKKLLENR